MIGPSMKRAYTVFGRRSGPEDASLHLIEVARGKVSGARNPPSLETRTAVADAGGLTSSVTSGVREYCAPELIEMPSRFWAPTGDDTLRVCWAVACFPVPSVTRRRT